MAGTMPVSRGWLLPDRSSHGGGAEWHHLLTCFDTYGRIPSARRYHFEPEAGFHPFLPLSRFWVALPLAAREMGVGGLPRSKDCIRRQST